MGTARIDREAFEVGFKRGGTGPWGQYKTPGMLGFIRAQRGRARSALFSRVLVIFYTSDTPFLTSD